MGPVSAPSPARSCVACTATLIWLPSRPIALSYASCRPRCRIRACTLCTTRPQRCSRCCNGSDCRSPAISFRAFRLAACRSGCVPTSWPRLAPRSSPAVHSWCTISPAACCRFCSEPSATCVAASSGAICRRRSCLCAQTKWPDQSGCGEHQRWLTAPDNTADGELDLVTADPETMCEAVIGAPDQCVGDKAAALAGRCRIRAAQAADLQADRPGHAVQG